MDLKFINYADLSSAEHEVLLNIRNSDYVRLEGLNTQLITMPAHLQWVESLANNPSKKYYAVLVDDDLVGGINLFDIGNSEASWGLFFKEHTNPLIPSLSAYVLFEKAFTEMALNKLFLEVKCDNVNACKFDLNFGFEISSQFEQSGQQYYKMSQSGDKWHSNKNKSILTFIAKKLQSINYNFYEPKD